MSIESASESYRVGQFEPVVTPEAQAEIARLRTAKHLADMAIFDEFVFMKKPESPSEAKRVYMQERIIEQDEAIDAIIDALDGATMRPLNDQRPIATFAFLGPTGVGKSQTAKILAELESKDGSRLVKIDCSNFSSGHEVAQLTGSPPGYVSRSQHPYLSKERIEQKGTVVLFDEIEKGSPELYNLMLQIMGDGELRLNNGKVTSFKDTIIILTSNLGAREMGRLSSASSVGFGTKESVTDKSSLNSTALKAFSDWFSPEFINRITKQVVFHSLSESGLGKVLDGRLEELNEDYERRYGINISLTPATRDHLVAQALGNERHLGARPLIRALESDVLTTLGRYIGAEDVRESMHVRVFHRSELPRDAIDDDRQLVFSSRYDGNLKRQAPPPPMFQEPPEQIDDDDDTDEPGTDLIGPITN